jgi:hypothetical protein
MIITEADRKTGLEMASALERVYVKAGHIRPMIGEEIAKGIALGRQQGLDLAAAAIESELPKLAERIRTGQISN